MLSVLPLLQLTWRLYKENASVFLGYSAWILVPYVLLTLRVMTPLPSGLATTVTAILYLAQGILIAWAMVAIVIVTFAIIRKKDVKLETLGRKAWRLVPHFILVAILNALVVLGGTILFIVPGLVFWVWYGFIQLEVVLHKKRGWEAFVASRDLVRGRFWPVAWRLLGGPLFIILCYFFAASILVALIALFTNTPEALLNPENAPLWVEVVTSILEMLALPLFVIYSTVLYLDVRSTQEK